MSRLVEIAINFVLPDDTDLVLLRAAYYYQFGQLEYVKLRLLGLAIAVGNSAPLLCFQVLRECKKEGKPKIDTLQRLERVGWISERLGRNINLSGLQNALEIAQQQHDLHTPRDVFASEKGMSVRKLDEALHWYRLIEEGEREAIEGFKPLLPGDWFNSMFQENCTPGNNLCSRA